MAETTPATISPCFVPGETDRIDYLGSRHTVWHYTNLAGLDGILRSRTLWASSAAMLNDSTEMQHGLEVAEEVLGAWQENHPGSDPEGEFLLKSLNTASEMMRANEVMVACASTEDDDLAQWRAYSLHGQGYAIGLGAAWIGGMLDNSDPPCVQMLPGSPTMWGRVVYGRLHQQQLVERVIDRALLEFQDAESESERGWLVGGTAQMLSEAIAHMKHEGFRSESEVRLVQTVSSARHARWIEWMKEEGFNSDQEAEVPPVDPESAKCLRVRQSAFGLTPYLALTRFPRQPQDAEGRPDESEEAVTAALQTTHLPITCIRVGPGPNQDAAGRGLEASLPLLGYEGVKVKESKVPYR